ncbi:glycosyltransferase family 2 protein [Candidatus Beckwithbacteria bacterium]|nr:glycosyltransferase family 2 protein [Candidatus Beckwithbacteria bacterium]
MTNKISIIILHFGAWIHTKECLDSLLKIKNPKFKVIIIDNSLDKEIQEKIKNHSRVDQLLIPEKNLGFAGGNNLGIKTALENESDYILFLNNDTLVSPDFLTNLLEVMEKEEKLGIAGPVIEHKVKDKTLYDYGGFIEWTKGQAKHLNKTEYKIEKDWQIRHFVSGCCMLTKRQILQKIKGFDETFFLYLEDVDFCLRAKLAGFEIALIPQAKIFHKGSQSSTELTKIAYSLRNSLKLVKRHIPKEYKFRAYLFNLYFYPSIFFWWNLKRLKNLLLK